MKSFKEYFAEGNVAFYGFRGSLPREFKGTRVGRTRQFTQSGVGVPYRALQELRDERADVYFLDHEATKVLVADFPATARFVALNLVPRVSWFFAIPGLVRRLYLGLLRYETVVTLTGEDGTSRWIVFRHILSESLHTRLSLSEEVGVAGLIAFLNARKTNYVVLRFFEHLPDLGRVGGDLDLLIGDEDEVAVKSFLQSNPGPITVDAWTVSRKSFNDITYYPPPLARSILASAVVGPGGARVPEPTVALHSFIYHVLYHKGYVAGVPSEIEPGEVNKTPDNDYAAEVTRLMHGVGIDIPLTMEALDEYLKKTGWRPKLDTLAKIAPRNAWVRKRFFTAEQNDEVGLGIFIIKERAVLDGTSDAIVKDIRGVSGFRILREVRLLGDDARRSREELRGGVWHDARAKEGDLDPAVAVLVIDEEVARKAKAGTAHAAYDQKIRDVKKRLRKQFDSGVGSVVHATDNTKETWEYVSVVFPDEVEKIRHEVQAVVLGIPLTLFERIALWAKHAPRLLVFEISQLKGRIRELLLRSILG